jgi:hypothetical protein
MQADGEIHMGMHFRPDQPQNRLQAAVQWLIAKGHRVERATDIPGLYYLDNGPELTEMQVISFAASKGFDG